MKIACDSGFSEVVKVLLTHPKVDVTSNNFVCFMNAAENGHLDVRKYQKNRQKKAQRQNDRTQIKKKIPVSQSLFFEKPKQEKKSQKKKR